jgi:hypothetical protein
MPDERFVFEFDPRFRRILRPLGVTEETAEVVLTDQMFVARFGRLGTRTPLENVADASIISGFRWYKVIGARLSLADRGVTFGTTTRAGVCVRFHRPVAALLGDKVRHPGLTVTVADPEGLVAALQHRIEGRT